ncbi:heme/hemin ABC transporter substrate-binding protein [Olivibacter sitiensis]|uniref:heme/hemin ABC transporter substrate-binding protein n=1 Tax=Olivibacter sitiensis TaxID=376470 RepID=UPI000A0299B2|nr:ABC transporter substrate-binding protein [Olivibacter sitiensis]
MKKSGVYLILTATFLWFVVGCRGIGNGGESKLINDSTKIVSLNGTLSEIVAALGLENHIVGTDVASTYPASLYGKPKVGHGKKIAAEGVLALHPDLVLGVREDVTPELEEQLRSAGARLLIFEHVFSVDGTKSLIKGVADSLGLVQKGDSIIQVLEADLKKVEAIPGKEPKPKVLFIYARGTGTMMVGGEGTQMEEMIRLAGGENAVSGFSDFKPLTSEALVAADPDVLLLFSSGLESLGGANGLEAVQGVMQTNAGRNKNIVDMDGQLLTGFGPRLGLALLELKQKINH